MKRSVLRFAAEHDIDSAFSHYVHDASKIVASRFIESVDNAINHIQHHPASGSARFGVLLNSPDLRSWILTGFPYTLFYIERENHVDIIRLLHQHADIPVLLQDAI